MKKLISLTIILISILLIGGIIFNSIRAVGQNTDQEIFILKSDSPDSLSTELESSNFIRSFTAFNILYSILGNDAIEPGGYYLSRNMNTLDIINEINNGPDLVSITIVEGLRKEQIGERVGKKLSWDEEELDEWNNAYTKNNTDYEEGVYFPDTYLIPVDETPTQVSNRFINNFNKNFEPYFQEAIEKNIKWTTALKIASLIQREAGGESDMALISGVIWNRLENNQLLQIDASIQYALGKRDDEWWSNVTGSDIRNSDSLYNNYRHKGLPPTPIANPGIGAIEAALNPEETNCLFYLHDRSRQIHCSISYQEHLDNIEKYLN